MSYDIDSVVSPQAVKQLTTLERSAKKTVANITNIQKAAESLDAKLKTIDTSKFANIEKATKNVIQENNLFEKSVKKLIDTEKKAQKIINDNAKAKEKNAKASKENTDGIVKLKVGTSAYLKTLVALSKQKEKATKKTADQIKMEKDLEIVNSKTAGTLTKLAAKNRLLRREIAGLNLDEEKGRKRLKELNAELDKNNARIKDSADSLKKQKIGIGGYQDAIENSIPALRGMGGAVKGVSAQFKAMLANPVVLILAGIVGAFMLLKNALTRSEAGQNRYNKLMEILGAVLNVVMDVVTKVAIVLFDAFSKPQKAVKELWAAIKSNIVVRIQSVIKLFGALGGIIKAAMHFDTKGIKKNAKAAANAFVDMNTGIKDTVAKTKKFLSDEGDAINKSVKAATKKADYEEQYNVQYRKNIKENAKLAIKQAVLFGKAYLLQRTEGKKSIEALKAGYAVQKKIAENNYKLQLLKTKEIRAEAAEAKNDIAMNNKLAEAEAALSQKRAAIAQVDVIEQRRLSMVRMQAATQEKQRAMQTVTIQQALLNKQKAVNKELLDDTRLSLSEKIKLLADEWHQEDKVIEAKDKANRDFLTARLKLKLISQKDYDLAVKALDTKLNSDLKKSKVEHEKETKAITLKYLDETLKAEQAHIDQATKDKIIALKKELLDGEISQQDYEQNVSDIQFAASQKRMQAKANELKAEIDNLKGSTEQKAELQQQYYAMLQDMDDASVQHKLDNKAKEKAAIESYAQTAMQLEAGIANFTKALSDRKISNLQAAEKKELAAAGDDANKKKQIQEKYHAEIAKIKRKQAIRDKEAALFNIAINTAVAVMKVWGQTGIFGIAAQIPVLIMGALQAAAVIAKPIPKYAKGVRNAPAGLAIVGEAGTEIVEQSGKTRIYDRPSLINLKRGANVFNSKETERIIKDGGKDDYYIKEAIDGQTASIVDAIVNKQEFHFNTRGITVTDKDGNYFKTYINRKIEV